MAWVSILGSMIGKGAQPTGPNNGTAGQDDPASKQSSTGNAGAVMGIVGNYTATANPMGGSSAGSSAGSAMHFYGGETVTDIKKAKKVNVVGGQKQMGTKEDRGFYSNVYIPKKKV